jgi:hypothetical protein
LLRLSLEGRVAGLAPTGEKVKAREFSADQVAEAVEFIGSLRPDSRVYIDERVDHSWRFIFSDQPEYVRTRLNRLRPGARFRVRLTTLI